MRAVALLLLAAAVAGCGGESDATADPAEGSIELPGGVGTPTA